MVPSKRFNFTTFKSIMNIKDIDEENYSFLLRTIFSYLKRSYGIDLDATESFINTSGTVSLLGTYSANIRVGQEVTSGTETSVITNITTDILGISTIVVSPAFTIVPTTVTISLYPIEYDLQYGIYQHAKYLFDAQKGNIEVISSDTDPKGTKVTYNKSKVPRSILQIYAEYSLTPIAFT